MDPQSQFWDECLVVRLFIIPRRGRFTTLKKLQVPYSAQHRR
jgi:hypothetical protein